MLSSIPVMALAALSTLPYIPAVGAVSDGPNKLKECTYCEPIYMTMVKCQAIKRPGGIGKEITNCICVPNPDGWYGYLHKCRDCLSGNDFFDNLSSMITQLFTSCTNAGGNVVSDGQSICASNAMWNLCASLNDGSDGTLSWASFKRFSDPSQNSNATQLLYIDAPKGSATGVASATSKTRATTAATETGGQESSATTDSSSATGATLTNLPTITPSSGTSAGSDPRTATTDSRPAASTTSSSAGGLSGEPQTGYVLGLLAAAALVRFMI